MKWWPGSKRAPEDGEDPSPPNAQSKWMPWPASSSSDAAAATKDVPKSEPANNWRWRRNNDSNNNNQNDQDLTGTSSLATIVNSLPDMPEVTGYINLSPETQDVLDRAQSLLTTTEGAALFSSSLALAFAVGFKAGRVQPAWRRFTQVSEISDVGQNSPFLRGRVLSVSDGDTIRFLHSPTIFSSSHLKEGEKLSDTALPIRIATIDTPEVAKFGKPGQPYGEQAKEHLSSMILDDIVRVRLLAKDQYGRGVGQVVKPRLFGWLGGRDMDTEMLQAGLAEVYRGGGAVYGPKGKEKYIEMEEKAREKGKGMWKDKNRESAAEFKKRMKEEK